MSVHRINNEERLGTHFQLRPYETGPSMGSLFLCGYLVRRSGELNIEYRLEGGLDCIRWPGTSRAQSRCHELWRQTCFELFFGVKGDPSYREVNLSPSGCWNVYHFTDYRTGMREDTSLGHPVFRVICDNAFWSLVCTINLKGFIDDHFDLEVGVCSVLQTTDGNLSYWAIDHPETVPDFHNRTGFCVQLPGVE